MAQILREQVTAVHHWTDRLFSFKTTRNPGFRFKNGHFTMIGLEQEGKPLMRAYSLASANYEDELEFFSIKVPDGPLTSKLQSIKVGDSLLVNSKATGTLVQDNLLPGKHLYLIAHGHRAGAISQHHSRPGDLRAVRQDRAHPRLPLYGGARLP